MTTRALTIAGACGVLIGIAYTLSPLSVWFVLAFAVLCLVAVRDLSTEDRRIVIGMLVVAAVLRLAVVGGLFLATDHSSVPFGSLFGDEEYFKRRSLWLRSMALDVDISVADKVYATDENSDAAVVVTGSMNFTTITNFPGVPKSQTLVRTVQMRVAATQPAGQGY